MLASKSFESAFLSGDIHEIRAYPHAHLHRHGFAKADRDYVRERTGREFLRRYRNLYAGRVERDFVSGVSRTARLFD